MRLEFYPFPLLTGLGILVILLILLRRRRSPAYLFCFAVFWVYLLFVACETIFPVFLPEAPITRSPAGYILSRVNLVPFNFGSLFDASPVVILEELPGNILLTLPFGFGISFLVGFNRKTFPWLAVGAGLALEMAQLGMNLLLGGVYHSVDINDVLLKTAGVLLGFVLFRGFAWLYLAVSRRIRVKQSGLFAFIYEVAIHG